MAAHPTRLARSAARHRYKVPHPERRYSATVSRKAEPERSEAEAMTSVTSLYQSTGACALFFSSQPTAEVKRSRSPFTFAFRIFLFVLRVSISFFVQSCH